MINPFVHSRLSFLSLSFFPLNPILSHHLHLYNTRFFVRLFVRLVVCSLYCFNLCFFYCFIYLLVCGSPIQIVSFPCPARARDDHQQHFRGSFITGTYILFYPLPPSLNHSPLAAFSLGNTLPQPELITHPPSIPS